MGDESDAFYVVRKGNVIGVYRSMSDVQALVQSSANDPGFSVFKGYCLPKEAEDHLASHGLKNAMYSIDAQDLQDSLFGPLVTCPFRLPITPSKEKTPVKSIPEKRPQEAAGSASFLDNSQAKFLKVESALRIPPVSSYCNSCTLEFDGASKGNPGPAGAGAVLRAADNSVVFRLREGVGIATNNAAEYRGCILGLKFALERGFKHIRVHGDSKLVCMQVQGAWKCKNQNMADLCKVAKELKDQFLSFEIKHIDRELNSDADRQANLGVYLKNGETQVESA